MGNTSFTSTCANGWRNSYWILQRSLLGKFFNASAFWILSAIIGFIITELIAGIILWKLNINRAELRFIENAPLPEGLIFACAGLLMGLLQLPELKRHFSRSVYWVVASTLGWGICIIITLIDIWAFFLGALLYGAITGAALVWVLKINEKTH